MPVRVAKSHTDEAHNEYALRMKRVICHKDSPQQGKRSHLCEWWCLHATLVTLHTTLCSKRLCRTRHLPQQLTTAGEAQPSVRVVVVLARAKAWQGLSKLQKGMCN